MDLTCHDKLGSVFKILLVSKHRSLCPLTSSDITFRARWSAEGITVIDHTGGRSVGRSVGHSCSLGFHSREEKDGGISIMQYIMQLHAADVTCDDKNTVTWHDMTDM